MKRIIVLVLVAMAGGRSQAQQPTESNHVTAGATFNEVGNLPVEKLGKNDLIGITVYDSPELTRTVRIDSDGTIRLPMLKQRVNAAGLKPDELENSITAALVKENVLVSPIVTVSVVEYRSRTVTVSGAVKNPSTVEATGSFTLLDAISKAGGLSENAGAEILVTHPAVASSDSSVMLTERIPVHALLSGDDQALNIKLDGGENIRVPEAGRVYVVGDVKKPGAYYITDGSESSVMKALSLSEGLDTFSAHTAYVYRLDANGTARSEIPVELGKIMSRKAPDVPLMANDILYIPNAAGLRAGLKVLETSVGVGAALGGALIYAYH